MKPQALIVFVKTGQQVKTRIAAETNEQTAIDIYNQLISHCASVCSAVENTDILVFYTPYIDAADVWDQMVSQKILQSEGDLGTKMSSAFRSVLQRYQKAIIIGSDCPYLTVDIIVEAFKSLDTADVVIGPAKDGGYYLLGMKNLHHQLFDGIEWSTDTVYYETIDRIFTQGLSVKILTRLSDIDYYIDYVMWKNSTLQET